MAKTPSRAKAGRSGKGPAKRQISAKPGAKTTSKTGKPAPRRSSLPKGKQRPPVSFADIRRRVAGWLDHAGGRFSVGIGIGLLVGLIVVLGFNRFNHWVAKTPDGHLTATGELTAPMINDTSTPAVTAETPAPETTPPATSAATASTAPGATAPVATASAPSASSPTVTDKATTPPTNKTMEQLITDSQSEITEPDAGAGNAPASTSPSTVASQQTVPSTQPASSSGSSGSEIVAALPVKPAHVTPTPRDGDQPAWLRNAVALHGPVTGPMIAIVLDDVGVNKPDAELAINLPAPITLSMMTYADDVADLAARAHAHGHELMLHVPMEPVNPRINPGPNALLVGLAPEELKRRLDWGLDRFSGFIGINNHMGSRFTQDEVGMRLVMRELQSRGLLFLDSRTIPNSVGEKMAGEAGVPHVGRDIFLDDTIALLGGDSVARQLANAEHIATKRGYVIAIGHPHPTTVAVLQKWMADLKQRGFTLVPLSAVARREVGLSG